jgi:hypothetical protein
MAPLRRRAQLQAKTLEIQYLPVIAGAKRTRNPGVQVHIRGLVRSDHPGMTT